MQSFEVKTYWREGVKLHWASTFVKVEFAKIYENDDVTKQFETLGLVFSTPNTKELHFWAFFWNLKPKVVEPCGHGQHLIKYPLFRIMRKERAPTSEIYVLTRFLKWSQRALLYKYIFDQHKVCLHAITWVLLEYWSLKFSSSLDLPQSVFRRLFVHL